MRRLRIAVAAIVEKAHKGGDPERAGHQHGFVVRIRAELAHLVEDSRGLAKLVLSQPDLADEAVQMFYQRHQNFPHAGVGGALHRRERVRRDIVLAPDDHCDSPSPLSKLFTIRERCGKTSWGWGCRSFARFSSSLGGGPRKDVGR